MRRVAVLVATAGLALVLAACGDDDNGGDGGDAAPPPTSAPATPGGDSEDGAGTEEICDAGEQLITDLEEQGGAAQEALAEAATSGDPEQLEQARADYLDFVGAFAAGVREIATNAEDPELRTALEDFADEYESVGEQVAEDPEGADSIDTSGLDEATAQLGLYCGA